MNSDNKNDANSVQVLYMYAIPGTEEVSNSRVVELSQDMFDKIQDLPSLEETEVRCYPSISTAHVTKNRVIAGLVVTCVGLTAALAISVYKNHKRKKLESE